MTDLLKAEKGGILVLNKSEGMSSAWAVGKAKKLFNIKKAGHTGTLDPMATGVLVCLFGKATKLATFLTFGEKEYEATLRLGKETDTLDRTGTVTAECENVDFADEDIIEAVMSFEGTMEQKPPVYSALKHNGVPLYKLARMGKPVEKPARTVTISQITGIEIDLPLVKFTVRCSAGTYIRTLCSDIGKKLGCGGLMEDLQRTETSGFRIKEAISLDAITDVDSGTDLSSSLRPMSDALEGAAEIKVSQGVTDRISKGMRLSKIEVEKGLGKADQNDLPIKLLSYEGRLLALLDPEPNNDGYQYFCVLC